MEKTLEAYFIKEFENLRKENEELKNELNATNALILKVNKRYYNTSNDNYILKMIVSKFLGKVDKDAGYWRINGTSYDSEFAYDGDEEAQQEFIELMEKAYEIQNENKEVELDDELTEKDKKEIEELGKTIGVVD